MTAEERKRWDRRDKYIEWLIVGSCFVGAVVAIYVFAGPVIEKLMR
jgi:hypothetical protein